MEDTCSPLSGETFRNRRDKFHPGISKTSYIRLPTLFKPSSSHYGVSNRKPLLLCCGALAYGLHKFKNISPPARDYVNNVRNNTLGRNLFSCKITEDHCSLLPGEPFRNRRDKFNTGINKTTHTTPPCF
ncbi:hypothetical protein CEXT_616391 [Caerostris extrusa]|uniref:Uncharacterized protein n=1 Tax=Caerostris extrusa TaxID=172846 RepID=A0AAV4W7I8_CAEEX|nr:hypothetical protein CEXT_616391 [Caerostris extrusa]